ncbi:hypothetical protein DUI87_33454 [Hirundo rustica rustica]|uniref:Uncharacterized protein n=1 Tax=Hirundo rustica rustica TaxID=333673 RepID=A0A3M0INB4_HIRRU|nr:hypothetical protein DUI87_33454 [Hirundo rustica rustica]
MVGSWKRLWSDPCCDPLRPAPGEGFRRFGPDEREELNPGKIPLKGKGLKILGSQKIWEIPGCHHQGKNPSRGEREPTRPRHGNGKKHGSVGADPEEAPELLQGLELGWESWECSPGEEKLWNDLVVTFQDLEEPPERRRETIPKGWRDRTQGMAST